MSETQHTPGPWTLTTKSGTDVLIGAFEIRGMFGEKPNVYPIFQQSRSAIDGATVYLHPADAHLIAAAPELLGALTALRSFMWSEGYADQTEAMAQADEAIAKAEGLRSEPAGKETK